MNKNVRRKIVNIFLSISFNICLGTQKNHIIKRVLLSTHNIMLWLRNENFFFCKMAMPGLAIYNHLITVRPGFFKVIHQSSANAHQFSAENSIN